MRIMSMHKANAQMEAGVPPSPEFMASMGALMQEIQEAGIFIAGEGLLPSSTGVRLNFSDGQRTITKGPFVGANELIAGYCLMKASSIEETIEWASRFAEIVGDVEIDIRPICEPWDLGMFPKPENETKTRFMLTHKADAHSESGAPPSPRVVAAMDALTNDMKRAGVFLAAEGLQPSSRAVRLRFKGDRRTIIDGPFTESKELIAGFSILELPSNDEAIVWASKFAKLIGDVEIDIRPMV